MKKTLALILCFIFIASLCLVGCNGEDLAKLDGKTPQELFAESRQKLADYTRYKAVTEQTIIMEMQGVKLTMPQTVVSIVDGQNSYVKSEATDPMTMKPSVNAEAWYVDGVLYNGLTKIKADLPWDTYVSDYLGGDPSGNMLVNLPEEWFKDIKFEKKEGSDNYFLVFNISGDKYEELFSKTGLAASAEISDVVYTVEFDKDGNLLCVYTDFSMNIQGVAASCTSTAKIIVEGVEAVTAPADAETYRQGVLKN